MGKKKKSGKKKGKSKEPQMTAKEAILAYQINIVEKKLEDMRYEIRGWEEKNKRHEERNEKLKEEQELLLQHLLKTSRETKRLFENEEIKTREHVIISMKDKWGRQRDREKELQELKSQIARKVVEIEEVQREVDTWDQFRDVGSHLHQTQIRILEQELRDMQLSFDEMSTHLHQNLLQTKADIEKYTEETLAQQKDKASDKAMAQLDKNDRQEVLDNDWLKKEVQIHRGETAKVGERVEDLERTNLEMMSKLFDCKVEDLKVSRNFYLTQCDEAENLDRTGILEMDLRCLSPLDPNKDSMASLPIKKDKRPRSSTQKAVEDKVFSLTDQATSEVSEAADAETDEDEYDAESDFMLEVEDFDDYLRLGPVELKLLSIAGAHKPIHQMSRPSSAEMALKDCKPDMWPVTQPMLKKVVTPRPII
ncbi:coiled-coil domain-containing protein 83-like [Littorina saxatilis]|uniref:Coiled-coil domain-containing protein 83-like protein n=1 Tax=Littorina saxatilis TaxID=31220 RepID=A0AAN9BLW7_9CAEN